MTKTTDKQRIDFLESLAGRTEAALRLDSDGKWKERDEQVASELLIGYDMVRFYFRGPSGVASDHGRHLDVRDAIDRMMQIKGEGYLVAKHERPQ